MDFGTFFMNILGWVADLLTLVMIGGVFYVIGLAVITMARNRQPRWDTILYTLVILAIGIALVQIYPALVVESIRTGLADARPEAVLLRDELGNWMPNWSSGEPTFSTAVPTVAPIPPTMAPITSTPFPLLAATAVPPTATPLPPTSVPTIDPYAWNPMTPPPTPGGK